MTGISKWLLAGFLVVGLLVAPGNARGDIVLSLAGTAAAGANTSYTYSVFLAPGSELVKSGARGNTSTGDIFTLYDFAGLVGTPTLSATLMNNGFTKVTIQNQGINPAGIKPTNDDASVPNITFKYTKSSAITNPVGGMDLWLGQFSVVSKFGTSGSDNIEYGAATQLYRPHTSLNGGVHNNFGNVDGPLAVPEPATLALVGICLPVLGGLTVLRRRKKEQV
jgi:hypothetical protein